MKKLYTSAALVTLAYLSFTATASAAVAATPEDGSLIDLAKPVYDAIVHGQYWLAASLALILSVAAFKKYAPGRAKVWARSEIGAPLLVLIASYGAAVVTALLASGDTSKMTMPLAWAALKVAVFAAGGYSLLKKLLVPVVRKLADKAPAWSKPIFTMILWTFETPVARAEVAGAQAVTDKPATGAAGVVGPPTDL